MAHDPGRLNFFKLPLGLLYPKQGNFIAFVGNLRSRRLVTRFLALSGADATFPSEGIAAPAFIPGVDWSDHGSIRQQGYPAVMITDTALYRFPYCHMPQDTPDKVDHNGMVHVVQELEKMLQDLLRFEE